MEVECVPVEDESRLAELRFDAAVKVIKSLPPNGSFQPSNDMMLKFYSYYKQATIGACNIPRPGFWDAVGRAKWGAWNSLGNMSKEEAMVSYVNEIKLILEGMPMTIEVEKFLRAIGPFYELVDEKKKISQVSDLSAARLTKFARQLEGFSTTVNSAVTKSIIRSMEMNGSLESGPAALKSKEGRESEEDDEEEEETTRKSSSQPKKKDPTRKHRTPLSNGKVANGDPHLSNGGHSRSTLNSEDSQDGQPLSNGHHADPSADVSSPSQLASDSDSEVYCDSVDQFGQEENSERNCSLDGLEDVESQVLAPVEESQGEQEFQEEQQVPPQVITYGGEDGENGALPSRQRFDENGSGSSAFRRGKGSKSPGLGSGNVAPLRSTGGGDGGRWGGAGKATGSLNEQIVVALARLQDDMQSVLERLHTLEALSASQARSLSLSPTCPSTTPQKNRKPSWWPFDISPPTFAFAIVWPFVVQWLISLYVRRRKRRIN